ncbi:hypothetical protein niasHT_020275 [Heterodera trifolii]|uniref:Uncharacterized protein n=1 Tax=Heterodera trifolii TaxID=157864 RepID=A0ABD2JG97_9BILA
MKKVRGREAAEPSSSVQHPKAHKKVENVNEIAEVESHDWNAGRLSPSDWNAGRLSPSDCNAGRLSPSDWNAGRLSPSDWNSGELSHSDINAGGLSPDDWNVAELSSNNWSDGELLCVSKQRKTGKWWSGGAPSKAFLMGVLRVCTAITMECGSGGVRGTHEGHEVFGRAMGSGRKCKDLGTKAELAQVEGYRGDKEKLLNSHFAIKLKQCATEDKRERGRAARVANGGRQTRIGQWRKGRLNETKDTECEAHNDRFDFGLNRRSKTKGKGTDTFSVQGTHEGVFDGCTRAARVHREHNGQMVERRRSIKSVFDGCTALHCLRMGENSDDANDEQHHHHKHPSGQDMAT